VTDKVINASALAAVAFQEAEKHDIRAQLAGHRLCAPRLLRYEMANVCIKKMRQHPSQRTMLIAQHARSLSLTIDEFDVDQSETLSHADSLKLTAYDASYLWFTRHLGVELVTLDGDLTETATKS
jgi:predicted nucleic acid-binding protein